MAALLIVFELAFIINTTISTALNFFVAKSKFIGLAQSMIKKYQKKKTDESTSGTPLVSLDESGSAINEPEKRDSKETILNERSQVILTFIIYIITVVIAFYSDNVILTKRYNQNIGIYIDNKGKEHVILNKCPHLGCSLIFNEIEHTWDCPCHASRFTIDGKCIIGPSNKDITFKD